MTRPASLANPERALDEKDRYCPVSRPSCFSDACARRKRRHVRRNHAIDKDKGTITLSDGKIYMTPSEFNFDGLKPGLKVVIYYSTTDGKRVIDDLQTE